MPKKGVTPPHLRKYLFKAKGKRRSPARVTTMARRRSGGGRRRTDRRSNRGVAGIGLPSARNAAAGATLLIGAMTAWDGYKAQPESAPTGQKMRAALQAVVDGKDDELLMTVGGVAVGLTIANMVAPGLMRRARAGPIRAV